ncbi:hypothetical protein ACMXYW_04640 [Neptuniibacter sp. QD48_55]|uniref:hypothetical protein n=1 Tax=Neptuniibacter sp. QD48_55 TaxID=3398212 RepID=UPI0039F47C10
MDKMKLYEEMKIKEKARALSKEKGIPFEQAYQIIKKLRADIAAKEQKVPRTSSSAKRDSANRRRIERNNAVNDFGNKLISGAPPLQGGAPGSGKKK